MAPTTFTLRIGTSDWRIIVTNRIPRYGAKYRCNGVCRVEGEDKRMYIRASLDTMEFLVTFCHELTHCLELQYGLDISHDMVYKLEKPIADFLNDNYGVKPWMLLRAK